MASRLNAARIGAAILGASVALMASALPASAETNAKPDRSGDKPGLKINLEGKGDVYTGLIGLRIEGKNDRDAVAQTYCVELPQPVAGDAGMIEVPWGEHPGENSKFNENSAKVNWILHNSYPAVEASKLGEGVSEQEAIAATQAAIWHFSDGAELNKGNALEGHDDSEADVVKVYEHLTGDDNVGLGEQPTPTLTIEPGKQSGKSGELIGPFTVTTTADELTLVAELPDGVVLADKDGNALPKTADNTYSAKDAGTKTADVYVKVPADAAAGDAKFAIHVAATLDKGRLFIRSDKNKKTQSLIVASPVDVELDAKAVAEWTPAAITTTPSTETSTPDTTTPTTTTEAPATTTTEAPAASAGNDDDLASTGASIFVPLTIGVVLIGAGAGALLIMRRRKSA